MPHLSTRFQIATACGVFILLGAAFLPFAGVQFDEALFTVPLYVFMNRSLSLWIFHRRVSLMAMFYVGYFLYAPIFACFGTGVWA
ncbi:MAG: hypothetical protein ACRD30_08485, partial [Bryobacteraceae bacterium]